MKKGRVTIPTDADFIEGTKKFIELWGADAVRDCDGTELPSCASELVEKVYKTYFLARGDNDFAYSHYEYLQNVALISEINTAIENVLIINLLKGYYGKQLAVNETEPKKYWQVYDRSINKEINNWHYDSETKSVIIENVEYMHEYTVSFFAKCLWDPTQIYNYMANGWTTRKDRDINPVFPEVIDKMKENLLKWISENTQVNVIRFTTFFYGIRCVCVSPGPVLTREAMAKMKTLLNRAANPQEIIDLILFIASDKGQFINGENIMIDGGRNAMGRWN